jgi:acetyl esterase/lipase
MTPLAHDLASRGLAAWNVEYRGTGRDGGGWPTTLLDVAAAVDHLALREEIDAGRVAVCGHSAGGHLALWACARHRLPLGSVLGAPRVRPVAGVSIAGVLDLDVAAVERLGDGAVQALLEAEPDEAPERYAQASPSRLLPTGASLLLVHGDNDDDVPLSQSSSFASLASASGDRVDLRELTGADHFAPIDPDRAPWADTAAWLQDELRR